VLDSSGLGYGQVASSGENGSELPSSIKCAKFLN
jgi:hypothetical protein